ncbi:oligosaccharyl transferase subunit ost3/OST6 [Rhizina undulata]
MRVLAPTLTFLLSFAAFLPTSLAVAKDSKLALFTNYASSSKSTKAGVLQLDDKLYDELTTAPRDYTAVVLLTALDSRFGCQLCKDFQPEYELLAKSWMGDHKGGDGLFFGMLDFENGRSTFQKLKLNTAPALYLFPPTTGPHANTDHIDNPIQFEFTQNRVPAEAIVSFISRHSHHNPQVHRPFNYTKLAVTLVSMTVVATILKVAFTSFKPLLFNRNLWAALSLIAILLFTSGHMFNHIRRVPYIVNDGRGGVAYIAGGFSNQFGLETQIVAVVYAVLAFCSISLAMKTPRIEDPRRQKVAVLIWNGVLLMGFSFLMSLFKQKNGGYPFYLPPLM